MQQDCITIFQENLEEDLYYIKNGTYYCYIPYLLDNEDGDKIYDMMIYLFGGKDDPTMFHQIIGAWLKENDYEYELETCKCKNNPYGSLEWFIRLYII